MDAIALPDGGGSLFFPSLVGGCGLAEISLFFKVLVAAAWRWFR